MQQRLFHLPAHEHHCSCFCSQRFRAVSGGTHEAQSCARGSQVTVAGRVVEAARTASRTRAASRGACLHVMERYTCGAPARQWSAVTWHTGADFRTVTPALGGRENWPWKSLGGVTYDGGIRLRQLAAILSDLADGLDFG